jgi:hypothetical protein
LSANRTAFGNRGASLAGEYELHSRNWRIYIICFIRSKAILESWECVLSRARPSVVFMLPSCSKVTSKRREECPSLVVSYQKVNVNAWIYLFIDLLLSL